MNEYGYRDDITCMIHDCYKIATSTIEAVDISLACFRSSLLQVPGWLCILRLRIKRGHIAFIYIDVLVLMKPK